MASQFYILLVVLTYKQPHETITLTCYIKRTIEKEFNNLKTNFKSNDWEEGAKALEYVVTQRIINIKKRIDEYQEKDVPFQMIMNEKEQVNLVKTS